ncbi:MAG: hypothetical protein LBL00_08800 [Endomicrobium sp.]|jgi:hypothetical protein|nr:hypothetical protein [Endomicrobium sp.]
MREKMIAVVCGDLGTVLRVGCDMNSRTINTISYDEAVEKMAEAIFYRLQPTSKSYPEYLAWLKKNRLQNSFEAQARAALEALLKCKNT